MGEELELVPLPVRKTEHLCADCGEDITYMDEVFLLQVVRPQLYQSRTLYHQVIDEHDVEGSFRFEPYYFCYRCWEQRYEEIQNDMRDELPVEDQASMFECVCCGSGIREFELAGVFTLGEFHVSDRAPNGVRGPQFTVISNSDMICIYCLTIMNEGYIDMWEDLSEYGECTDCVQARCWRGPPPDEPQLDCGCRCHHSPPEEEAEDESFPYPSFP